MDRIGITSSCTVFTSSACRPGYSRRSVAANNCKCFFWRCYLPMCSVVVWNNRASSNVHAGGVSEPREIASTSAWPGHLPRCQISCSALRMWLHPAGELWRDFRGVCLLGLHYTRFSREGGGEVAELDGPYTAACRRLSRSSALGV